MPEKTIALHFGFISYRYRKCFVKPPGTLQSTRASRALELRGFIHTYIHTFQFFSYRYSRGPFAKLQDFEGLYRVWRVMHS